MAVKHTKAFSALHAALFNYDNHFVDDHFAFGTNSYGFGQWTNASRKAYNLDDALTRHTVQVSSILFDMMQFYRNTMP